jgi:hypothetical protein
MATTFIWVPAAVWADCGSCRRRAAFTLRFGGGDV